IHVGVVEALPVAALGELGQHDLSRLGRLACLRQHPQRLLDQLQSAQALEDVGPPRAVVVVVAHRMAVLAVVDEVDAALLLTGNEIDHRIPQLLLVAGLVDLPAARASVVERDQPLGTRQAADVAGQDSLRAPLHLVLRSGWCWCPEAIGGPPVMSTTTDAPARQARSLRAHRPAGSSRDGRRLPSAASGEPGEPGKRRYLIQIDALEGWTARCTAASSSARTVSRSTASRSAAEKAATVASAA